MRRLTGAAPFAGILVLSLIAESASGAMLAPRRWVRPGGPAVEPAPVAVIQGIDLKSQHVTVAIEGPAARTSVEQVFSNPNPYPVEATYVFPIPADAALDKFTLTLDGKEIEGKVLEAEQAKSEFTRLVRENRNPALLSFIGQKAFQAQVAPIAANGEAKVKLQYTHGLAQENGVFSYRYPLDVSKFGIRPIEDLTLDLALSSTLPIKSIYSPSHEITAKREGENKASLSLHETNALPNRDFLCYFTLSEKEFGLNLLAYRERGDGGYFLAMLSPKQDPSVEEVAKKDVVFVVDSSGSMQKNDKMTQAKTALKFCLQSLAADDRFNILDFDRIVTPFRGGLVPCSEENRKAALDFVENRIQAEGGTAIHGALIRALEMHKPETGRPLMVLFMTDGLPTIGVTGVDQILADVRARAPAGVRVFSFGVGYDVNTKLLDTLAEENRGRRVYATPEENLEVKVSEFYQQVSAPLLTDVKVDFGSGIADVYPKGPYDIFKGSQIVVVGRYKESGKRSIRLTGVQNGKPVEFAYDADLPEESPKADFLPKLWATRRVASLLDEIRLKGETDAAKTEVVTLAKEFGIATPYTSFLVEGGEALADSAGPGGGSGSAGGYAQGGSSPRPMYRTAGRGRKGAKAPAHDAPSLGENAGAPGPMAAEAPMPPPMALPAAAFKAQTGREAVLESRRLAEEKDKGVVAEKEDGGKAEGAERRVGKRTFVMKDGFWTDTSFDAEKDKDKVVEVEYLGDQYLSLAADTDLSKCLALGEKVIVKIGDKVYKIAPKPAPAAAPAKG